MICTDTDNYVNVNYKERNQKPALLKLPIYSTELATVTFFFFEKYCVKCTKALAAILFFHRECVNWTISQQQL